MGLFFADSFFGSTAGQRKQKTRYLASVSPENPHRPPPTVIGSRDPHRWREEQAFSASTPEGFHRDLPAPRAIRETVGEYANGPSWGVVEVVGPQVVTIGKGSGR